MIEDRQLTREATWLCNNGEYKTVKQVAAVQLRWMGECPEVDPNPLGFVGATQWQLTPPEFHEYNVIDQSAQLSAVTKERDELREAVKRIAGNLDAAAARCRDDYERWDELILYRNLLLSAALQPPAEEQQT